MNSHTHLLPLSQGASRRGFIVYDIESKAADTQDAGFERPFLVGLYAGPNVWGSRVQGGKYRLFKNEFYSRFQGPRQWQDAHIFQGGCIDRMMHYVLRELPIEIENSIERTKLDGESHGGFTGLTVYAHNGGSFDHLHVLPWLRKHMDEFEFEVVPVQSSIQEMQVKRRGDKKALWFFRDSMKLLPMGLEKACKSFGVKGKLDHSLDLLEDHPLWEDYLEQDCRALDEVMVKVHDLVENRLGGSVGMTAPATSMNLFRRKYLKVSIPRHVHFSDCKDADGKSDTSLASTCQGCCQNFFRGSYYGGRTELFRMHGEGLRYYDINSSYVAALCEPMPVGSRFMDEGKIDWRMLAKGWIGFADVEVEIPEDCPVPPLPFKHPNGKLMFPAGKFRGTWDVAELLLLEHPRVRGKILKVGRVVWVQAKPIFRDMMLELYSFRDKSRDDYDDGLSLLAKLLGNGLYGKFGQKKDRVQIVFRRNQAEGECCLCGGSVAEGMEICKKCVGSKPAGDVANNVWYRHKDVDAQYIIPQISAHVTALARIRLFEFNQMALDKGGMLFMNDTDSLITDVEMPTSTELGDLKDEYPGEMLRYIGVQPKVYILEKMQGSAFEGSHLEGCVGTARKNCKGCAPWKATMKGFPRDQRTKDNILNLQRSLERQDGLTSVSFTRLEKVRSMAQKGFQFGPRMVTVEKSFQTPYSKRKVLEGGATMPMVIDFPWEETAT